MFLSGVQCQDKSQQPETEIQEIQFKHKNALFKFFCFFIVRVVKEWNRFPREVLCLPPWRY